MKYKRIVDEMAKFIVDVTGSCPYDMFKWQPSKDCYKLCDMSCDDKCWIKYFDYIARTEAK